MPQIKFVSKKLEHKLLCAIERDDNERLADVMKFYNVPKFVYSEILHCCLEFMSTKCAIAVMKGELGDTPVALDKYASVNSLIQAICMRETCVPEVLEPLVKNCYGHRFVNKKCFGTLPLLMVLGHLSRLNCLSTWTPEQSQIKLIVLLSLPEARPLLECARVIAEYTDSVNGVAMSCIRNCEFLELAALLLVAKERVMTPFVSGAKVTESTIYGQCSEAVPAVHGLLRIFVKAGDELNQYFRSLNKYNDIEDVIVGVAQRIQQAGFQVTYEDVDVSDVLRLRPLALKTLRKELGFQMDGYSKESLNDLQFPSVRSVMAGTLGPWTNLGSKGSVPPTSTQGVRTFSTMRQVGKISAAKSVTKPAVREMAYLAMKLKRGLRFL